LQARSKEQTQRRLGKVERKEKILETKRNHAEVSGKRKYVLIFIFLGNTCLCVLEKEV